jgi:hypothetical protein
MDGLISTRMHPNPFRLSRRICRALSVLIICVLALAPLVSSVAQVHEATHMDAHFHHDDGDEDVQRDLLHDLAHAAHACGHVVAIFSDDRVFIPAQLPSPQLPACIAASSNAVINHPFRPPISV